MNIFRNRFLNTTALLLGPNDPPGGGTQGDSTNDADTGADTGAEAGQDAGDAGNSAEGNGEEDDGGGDDGDGGSDADSDDGEDPELAQLPPEARVKAKEIIEKRIARETRWRDRQIDRLHAKARSAQEDVAAAATIVGQQPGAQQDIDPNRKFTAAEVKAEAAKLSAQERYDADCNTAFATGSEVFGAKWSGALAKLPKLGGVDVTDMVDILATDKPHVVLFSLSDPETYERVMALPPARRRTEFVKLSLKPEPKKLSTQPESKRPGDVTPPVRPLQTGRRTAAQSVDLADDKVDDDAWYAARNATRRKKFSEHA